MRELVEQSQVDIDMNERELALYIVSNMTQEEIDKEGWTECCQTRLNSGSRRPGITTKEIVGDRGSGESLWRDPVRRPSAVEKKAMIAKMVEIGVIQIMENNVYKFGDGFRIQSEGGAIGVRATGDVAKAVMVGWDVKFNKQLERLLARPLLYRRYIDDQNLLIESVKGGMRFDTEAGEMVQDQAKDDMRSVEERTMETVRAIGDSVDPMIQLTVDFPEKNVPPKMFPKIPRKIPRKIPQKGRPEADYRPASAGKNGIIH